MRLRLGIGIGLLAAASGVLVAEVALVGVNALYRQVTSTETPEWLLLGCLYGGLVVTVVVVFGLAWRRLGRGRP